MAYFKDDVLMNHPEFDNHFMTVRFFAEQHGFDGIISIHGALFDISTGGTRRQMYDSLYDAYFDLLPLSSDMSDKAFLAHILWDGAKSALFADPKKENLDDEIAAYAEALRALGGRFWTGEDMNFGVRYVDKLAERVPYVLGRSEDKEFTDGIKGGGDPSLSTKRGVLRGLEAVLVYIFDTADFCGRTFNVSGVGATGLPIAKELYDAGGTVYVSDKSEKKLQHALDIMPDRTRCKKIDDYKNAHKITCDIFVPCAIGNIINKHTKDDYDCKGIGGSANCIFTKSTAKWADYLHERGIVVAYAPRINGGGLIHIYHEYNGFNQDAVNRHVDTIRDGVAFDLRESKKRDVPPYHIAKMVVAKRREAREREILKMRVQ